MTDEEWSDDAAPADGGIVEALCFGADRILRSEMARAPTDAELEAVMDRSGSGESSGLVKVRQLTF